MRDLRCRAALRWLISSSPIGQGATHCAQRAGSSTRPLGQVQVERPDRGQALAVADPRRTVTGVFSPVAVVTVFVVVRSRCFQRGGDLGGQVQAVDAGMVAFEVVPEHVAQVGGEARRLV